MVVSKKAVRDRYEEIRKTVDNHDDAVRQLAGETGHDMETVDQVVREGGTA